MSNLANMIKEHEGLRLKPYKDSRGILTIGYGRNLEGKGISEVEANYLLLHDIEEVTLSLARIIPNWKALSENRKVALIDMTYNIGIGTFKGFYKMLKALSEENYLLVSEEMLNSKWAEQVGERAKELSLLVRKG